MKVGNVRIAELFAEVGFKFDSIKLHEVSKLIGDLNISSIIGASSVAALGVAMKDMIDQTAQLSSNLKTLEATTGIDNQFAQRFEDAAYALGASKDAAAGFLTTLSGIQTKIMMGQGGQAGFQLAQALGVSPVQFKQIMGTTEGLAKEVARVLSAPIKAGDQAQYERVKRLKALLGSSFGASPEIIKALERPDFFQEMLKFETLSNAQINESIEATKQWREAVVDVQTEFQVLATKFLPMLTGAVKSFVNDGPLKALVDSVKSVGDFFERLEIIKNYAKAGLMNIASAASQPQIAAARFHNQMVQAANMAPMSPKELAMAIKESFNSDGAAKKVTINMAPVTVHANDPQEFVRKFDPVWKKYLMNADLNFSQGQT